MRRRETVPASAGVTPALSGLISPPLSARNADGFLNGETRNRYRLRCAKLSEVVARSGRSLATVRMTDLALVAVLGWRVDLEAKHAAALREFGGELVGIVLLHLL
jgi:hypothetical protein